MFSEFLEKLLKMVFGEVYYDALRERVKKNDDRNIFSASDLANKYPDFKDKVIEKAKSKIKKQSEGLDQKYEESITKKFMNFDQGLKLVKGLVDGVVNCGFGNTSITETILKAFTSAVCTDGFLLFKEYHNSHKSLELYEVEESKNSDSFRLFYLYLEVEAEKIENFLYNESNTTLKAKYKVIKFSNLQALFEWASDQ
ncbi:hypothetical protein H6G04_35235 [Calothrix membranacea FACHB-236]|nr:hypothetical protein [Calothrix membranacea FACHB-236]